MGFNVGLKMTRRFSNTLLVVTIGRKNLGTFFVIMGRSILILEGIRGRILLWQLGCRVLERGFVGSSWRLNSRWKIRYKLFLK